MIRTDNFRTTVERSTHWATSAAITHRKRTVITVALGETASSDLDLHKPLSMGAILLTDKCGSAVPNVAPAESPHMTSNIA